MHIQSEKPMTSTVALVKPDAISAGHLGEILARAESKLIIADLTVGRWSRAAAESFYAEHRQQDFFPELIAFMTSGRLAFCTLVGPDAVETWREMMGSTNSAKAAEGTIRAMFGNKDGLIMVNCVHGSDSAASVLREAKIIRDHVAMGFGHEAMRIVSETSGV